MEDHFLWVQVRLAPSELNPGRLVLLWSPPHRGRDVAIPKDESVVFRNRRCLVRKTRAVQSAIHPCPAPISGKRATRPVASVGCRSQADNENPRIGIAKSRNRAPPVIPVAEGRAFRPGDLLAVSNEPRTLAACNNLGRHPFEAIGRHGGSGIPSRRKSVCPMENR